MLFLNDAYGFYRPCLASMAEMAPDYGGSIVTSSYYLARICAIRVIYFYPFPKVRQAS